MVSRQKTKTRTVTRFQRARSRARGGLANINLRKVAQRAAIGTAAGLGASFLLQRFAPNFADEGGIIAASLTGGVEGTVLWTLLGRRITTALEGAFGAPSILGAGQQVGL